MFAIFTSMLLAFGSATLPQTTHVRDGQPFQIQLLYESSPNGFWGLNGRDADHAVVVMNSDKDILVAFHTDRGDLNSSPRPKQVEAVLFDYSVVAGVETWTYVDSFLLGATTEDPLGKVGVNDPVKCERPDVVACGRSFLVVWTRRYEGLAPPDDKHPAVLECAWIDRDSSGAPVVYDAGGASASGTGLGFILDDAYEILECAGVPDAVVLDDGAGANLPEIAVVYPAQTVFSSGSNLVRSFELRIATCTLDVANATAPIASSTPADLIGSPVSFNGDDGMSAGMILPDLARGIDSNQFILAYEEQFNNPATSSDYGLIRMHRIERSAGTWSSQQSHTFGNAQSTLARRRPNLSSYFTSGGTVNNVTIAFNTHPAGNRNADADVVFSEWILDPNSGVYGVQWNSGVGQPAPGWPNDSRDLTIVKYDFRPTPLHGASSTFRRCYAETFQAPAPPTGNCDLIEYDLETNQIGPPLVSAPLARPAAAYLFDSGASEPNYVTLTWEQNLVTPDKWRIFLLVR